MNHLPQTKAQLRQPQQNTLRRYMIELRAAPTQALRDVPLAALHANAAAMQEEQGPTGSRL